MNVLDLESKTVITLINELLIGIPELESVDLKYEILGLHGHEYFNSEVIIFSYVKFYTQTRDIWGERLKRLLYVQQVHHPFLTPEEEFSMREQSETHIDYVMKAIKRCDDNVKKYKKLLSMEDTNV